MSDTNTSTVTEPSLQPVAGTPPVDLAAQIATMQSRLGDLQTALNKKHGEVVQANLLAESAGAQLTTVTNQLNEIVIERDAVKKEAATSKDAAERMRAIAKVNPALFADEEQGLLRPDLTGEAFVNHLTAYASRLQNAIGMNMASQIAGQTPPISGASRTNGTDTKGALMGQLRQAQRKGDAAGVENAYRLLQAIETKRP